MYNIREDPLYAEYVRARAEVWCIHDKLVSLQGFDKNEMSVAPAYVQALATERAAFKAWLKSQRE